MLQAVATSSLVASPVPSVVIMTAIREPALKRLAEAGFELFVTGGPAHAISQIVLGSKKPDALVIDFNLPEHRAAAVLRRLQQKKVRPACILFVIPTQKATADLIALAKLHHAEICSEGFDIPHITSQLRAGLGLPA